mmetsp:Transcript_38377/g.120306  ORF Transcript_38377/g.120306 Transcript_38377/m.120306 type:complete len:207 (+) Transcript_38377:1151-1771(+)
MSRGLRVLVLLLELLSRREGAHHASVLDLNGLHGLLHQLLGSPRRPPPLRDRRRGEGHRAILVLDGAQREQARPAAAPQRGKPHLEGLAAVLVLLLAAVRHAVLSRLPAQAALGGDGKRLGVLAELVRRQNHLVCVVQEAPLVDDLPRLGEGHIALAQIEGLLESHLPVLLHRLHIHRLVLEDGLGFVQLGLEVPRRRRQQRPALC